MKAPDMGPGTRRLWRDRYGLAIRACSMCLSVHMTTREETQPSVCPSCQQPFVDVWGEDA